ncbi:DUF1642 domain-containing protein [Listeria monocytogenes]|uniref:DUF1642 domain-containing protein n=1 Tax=Listeria monocytogenes TaxID=1639 RepID=UPI002AFF2CD0|nr:DUF1642 domain-containing protein [Listeria monocytogenes]
MKLKKGDRVEVVWRSELYRGVVEQVVEATDELVVKLDKKPAIDYLFNQNQVRKVKLVKVPQFVADWIKNKKENGDRLFTAMEENWKCEDDRVGDWFDAEEGRYELFARAWMDGYEVGQEKLYYVLLPYLSWTGTPPSLETFNTYLMLNEDGWHTQIASNKIEYGGWRCKLTEKQIKDMDERYWAFAVPVEDLEDELLEGACHEN